MPITAKLHLILNIKLPLFVICFMQTNFKGQVHCFSMQIVINMCFLLNPEKKISADLSFEKNAKKRSFNSEK